ncbi:MAG: aspartate carbamoyltransferase catalytic subunit [Alphaproteobacteria bacterium]
MKHLLGIEELSKDEILALLELSDFYSKALAKGQWDKERLRHKIVLNLFFEASTRTLTSFDFAAKRLGAHVVNWNPDASSLSKGESFLDTIDTLNAMSPDAVVIRHKDYGAPGMVAKRACCPVINGGDSWREHPTQALLDALTMQHHFGKLEGLTVAIIGDVAHSRVASSNIILLRKMGIAVRVITPEVLLPEKLPAGVEKFKTLAAGLKNVDVVMTLRLQKERMETALIASDEAYFRDFGISADTLDKYAPRAVLMDPGPLVRGVHIADDVADDPKRNLILKQVANGIPVRMAVLDKLVRGG